MGECFPFLPESKEGTRDKEDKVPRERWTCPGLTDTLLIGGTI